MTPLTKSVRRSEAFVAAWGAAQAIGQPAAAAISLASTNGGLGETVRACAFCERVEVEDAWMSEDDAVRALRTFENDAPPEFALTVCDECIEQIGVRRAAARVRGRRSPAR